MKNFLFGILAVVAHFCLFPLGFTSCDGHIEPEISNNESETGTAITSLSELYSALDGLPTNTVSTPHTIVVNLNSFIVIANALKSYPDKYVYLDISGSTFTSIGDYAFSGCTSLISISIGNSVTSIGYDVFYRCINLTSVIIGNGVTGIDNMTFLSHISLKSISVTIDNPIYSSENGILYNKNKTALLAYPRSKTGNAFTIPDNVTSIGIGAFSSCWNLYSVTIPDSVTSIGDYAFSSCWNLYNVTIPDGVTSIGDYAFSNCTSLYSVTIPDSVTSIGIGAFWYCSSLISVNFEGTIPSAGFSSSAFTGNLYIVYYSTNPSIGTPGWYTTTNQGVYPNWVRQT
ncbi:MAG: leucine-rich repeat domain-containing protein [Treponema sp.]|jgi:hypothetical protein|nr:leucine-rich repeat domain-containing protein [Treponema sp.]